MSKRENGRSIQLQARIPKELALWAQEEAKRRGVTVTSLVEKGLRSIRDGEALVEEIKASSPWAFETPAIPISEG